MRDALSVPKQSIVAILSYGKIVESNSKPAHSLSLSTLLQGLVKARMGCGWAGICARQLVCAKHSATEAWRCTTYIVLEKIGVDQKGVKA